MDRKLADFLLELAIDADKRAEYDRDPGAYIARSGLSPDAAKALTSGDRSAIAHLAATDDLLTSDSLTTKHMVHHHKHHKRRPRKGSKKSPRRAPRKKKTARR